MHAAFRQRESRALTPDRSPFHGCRIEVAQAGGAVKYEMHPLLVSIEIINHDERRAGYWIDPQPNFRLRRLGVRMHGEEVVQRASRGASFSNATRVPNFSAPCSSNVCSWVVEVLERTTSLIKFQDIWRKAQP